MGKSSKKIVILVLAILALFACLQKIQSSKPTQSLVIGQSRLTSIFGGVVARNSAKAARDSENILLSRDFRELAESMGTRDPRPGERDSKIKSLANNLSLSDAEGLVGQAMNEKVSHNARFLATYLLTLRVADFSRQLEVIAGSPNPVLTAPVAPHTIVEIQQHFEQSLRIQAILALDSLSKDSRVEQAFFEELARNPSYGPLINKIASVALLSLAKNSPQVEKFINATLEGAIHASNN